MVKAQGKGSSKKTSVADAPAAESQPQQSGIARDFFSGNIKDRTTKQSRDAAEKLAILKTKHKNPSWQPMNTRVSCGGFSICHLTLC